MGGLNYELRGHLNKLEKSGRKLEAIKFLLREFPNMNSEAIEELVEMQQEIEFKAVMHDKFPLTHVQRRKDEVDKMEQQIFSLEDERTEIEERIAYLNEEIARVDRPDPVKPKKPRAPKKTKVVTEVETQTSLEPPL